MPGNDPHVADHAAINVEDRIENNARSVVVLQVFEAGEYVHDCLKNLIDPDAHLRAGVDRFLGWDRENLLKLAMHGGQSAFGRSILLITGTIVSPCL